MNKEKRLVYLELAGEMDSVLCCFCKYSKCESGNSPCDCGEPYCTHPLQDRLEEQWGYMYGINPHEDCWGFRPAYSVDICVDITGICLAKQWDSAVWWQNKKGIWKIAEAL